MAGLLVLASCSKTDIEGADSLDGNGVTQQGKSKFSVVIDSETRLNLAGQNNKFDVGDEVNVWSNLTTTAKKLTVTDATTGNLTSGNIAGDVFFGAFPATSMTAAATITGTGTAAVSKVKMKFNETEQVYSVDGIPTTEADNAIAGFKNIMVGKGTPDANDAIVITMKNVGCLVKVPITNSSVSSTISQVTCECTNGKNIFDVEYEVNCNDATSTVVGTGGSATNTTSCTINAGEKKTFYYLLPIISETIDLKITLTTTEGNRIATKKTFTTARNKVASLPISVTGVWYRIDETGDWVNWASNNFPSSLTTISSTIEVKTDTHASDATKDAVMTTGQMATLNTKIAAQTNLIDLDMSAAKYAETTLAANAFTSNTKLKSIKIPNNITSIGTSSNGSTVDGAFKGCSNLKTFVGSASLKFIADATFKDLKTNLTSVTGIENVTTIGARAFEQCRALTDIAIPNGLTEISQAAFYYVPFNVTHLVIPEGVTRIGQEAFGDNTNFTELTLPSTLTQISRLGYYAINFSNVRTITIKSSSIAIPDPGTFYPKFATSGTRTAYVPSGTEAYYQTWANGALSGWTIIGQ